MQEDNNKAEEKPKPSTAPIARASGRQLGSGRNILILSGILLILIGVLALNEANKSDDSKSPSYSTNYQDAKEYLVRGNGQFRGISFLKANELSGSTSTGDDAPFNQIFNQLAKQDEKSETYVSVATLLAKTQNFGNPSGPSKTYRDALNTSFSKEFGSTFYVNELGLVEFAKRAFPESTVTVSLGTASNFTNSSITKDAWQFDVTTKDSAGKYPSHSGKLVYLIGKNTLYTFMVTAENENWQTNSEYYQKVLNSLKIDQ